MHTPNATTNGEGQCQCVCVNVNTAARRTLDWTPARHFWTPSVSGLLDEAIGEGMKGLGVLFGTTHLGRSIWGSFLVLLMPVSGITLAIGVAQMPRNRSARWWSSNTGTRRQEEPYLSSSRRDNPTQMGMFGCHAMVLQPVNYR